jgi:hypothetical protein
MSRLLKIIFRRGRSVLPVLALFFTILVLTIIGLDSLDIPLDSHESSNSWIFKSIETLFKAVNDTPKITYAPPSVAVNQASDDDKRQRSFELIYENKVILFAL